jgi:hypothetical protein
MNSAEIKQRLDAIPGETESLRAELLAVEQAGTNAQKHSLLTSRLAMLQAERDRLGAELPRTENAEMTAAAAELDRQARAAEAARDEVSATIADELRDRFGHIQFLPPGRTAFDTVVNCERSVFDATATATAARRAADAAESAAIRHHFDHFPLERRKR